MPPSAPTAHSVSSDPQGDCAFDRSMVPTRPGSSRRDQPTPADHTVPPAAGSSPESWKDQNGSRQDPREDDRRTPGTHTGPSVPVLLPNRSASMPTWWSM